MSSHPQVFGWQSWHSVPWLSGGHTQRPVSWSQILAELSQMLHSVSDKNKLNLGLDQGWSVELTFAAGRWKSIIARPTGIAIHAFDARLTIALTRMGITTLIFTSIYVTRALCTSFFGVDVPVSTLAAITCSADNVRATFTLTGSGIANTILRAAYVTVTSYKEQEWKVEKVLMILKYLESTFCFRRGKSLKRLSL